MNIDVSKFGDILVSRPAGRDAFLMAKAYIFNSLKENDSVQLDFSNVKVLTPSWADEFISGIKNSYHVKLEYLNTQNESVAASLKTVVGL